MLAIRVKLDDETRAQLASIDKKLDTLIALLKQVIKDEDGVPVALEVILGKPEKS